MNKSTFFQDYAQPAFFYLTNRIASNSFGKKKLYLTIRREYWNKIEKKKYLYDEAIKIIQQYSSLLEAKIQEVIKTKSYFYWIHVYRRIFPGKVINDCSQLEILNTRRIMEISFQKYGQSSLCNHISQLSKISIDKVFNGLYETPQFREQKKILSSLDKRMWVLTDFGEKELSEIYEVEKLCLEIAKVNKVYRLLGKGAILDYKEINSWYLVDVSDEINSLICNFDDRLLNNGVGASYLGAYYKESITTYKDGDIFFPVYNVGENSFDIYKDFFKEILQSDFKISGKPNFVFGHFDLLSFYKSHVPCSEYFFKTNKVHFELIIIIIYHFFLEIFSKFNKTSYFIFYIFRGYKLYTTKELITSIRKSISMIETLFNMPKKNYIDQEIKQGLEFLTFSEDKRKFLDINYCTLNYPLYKINNGVLIDFSWIYRTFLTLFFKMKMPDQNFKGALLEKYFKPSPVLPTGNITAEDGTEHQFDYSFAKENVLYILECKVVGMSVAFEKGEKEAVKFRIDDVVERSIKEIDIKAEWLKNHKEILKRYKVDIKYIVPIGVSPFVEYIPSKDTKYWLNETIPRVLTPKEIEYIKNNPIEILYNKLDY